MATSLNRLGYSALRSTYRVRPRKTTQPTLFSPRPFHTSFTRYDDAPPDIPKSAPPTDFMASLHPDDRTLYDSLSPPEREDFERTAQMLSEHMSSPRVESKLAAAVSNAAYELASEAPQAHVNVPIIKPGLMAMGEMDEQESGEDEEFEGDDMTSLAHGDLEQHREIREYARIAAWEMPLLSKLAKPFVPPAEDAPLRFRYTTYMGETHPASKKVVLEFCPSDLSSQLTPQQRLKLIKLVGVRYNPQKDLVKMSSEMFESQAQNKRYLGDLVDVLIAEAKNEEDMFEDVPVDFRHVKWKNKPRFPEEWKMTAQKRDQLEADRVRRSLAERERMENGMLVDGMKTIEAAIRAAPVVDDSKVLLDAQWWKGAKGKGRLKRGLR
ncbi:MAG: hypothetical protein Q9187_002422 [Circinaria calcarea]